MMAGLGNGTGAPPGMAESTQIPGTYVSTTALDPVGVKNFTQHMINVTGVAPDLSDPSTLSTAEIVNINSYASVPIARPSASGWTVPAGSYTTPGNGSKPAPQTQPAGPDFSWGGSLIPGLPNEYLYLGAGGLLLLLVMRK